MERPLILLCFWVFSYIFDDYLCLNCRISTKLSLIIYLINTDMSDVPAGYGKLLKFIALFREFCTQLTNIQV